jgi:hypothetical protein
MAVQYNIIVPQGATKVIPFKVTVLTDPLLDYDPVTNPRLPLDLTLASIEMQVRQTYNTSTVLLTATTLNGKFVTTNAIAGEFELRLSPADTVDFKFNAAQASYFYDIEARFSATNILRIAQGNFVVQREITRIA